jgi:hypothetical protein
MTVPAEDTRQGYQYKLMIEGSSSTMITEERVKAFEEIGFYCKALPARYGRHLRLAALRKCPFLLYLALMYVQGAVSV